MAQLIHDLVAGNHAFARDFDKHYRNLEMAKQDISGRSYASWLVHMRGKHARGKAKRLAAFQALADAGVGQQV